MKALDDKIQNNNRISRELESMAKNIYDYWFLQFEFPNEDGKPYKSSGGKMVWNDKLKREIPENWRVDLLGNLFTSNVNGEYRGESDMGKLMHDFNCTQADDMYFELMAERMA